MSCAYCGKMCKEEIDVACVIRWNACHQCYLRYVQPRQPGKTKWKARRKEK
jgi:hypothetical protein